MATSLENGIAAAKAGNKPLAMQYLRAALTENPRDILGWLWTSTLVDNPEKKRFCFQKILEVDPNNPHALKGLASLDNAPSPLSQSPREALVQSQNPRPAESQVQQAQPVRQAPVHFQNPPSLQTPPIQSENSRQPVARTASTHPPQDKPAVAKKPSKSISPGTILKVIAWGFLAFILIGVLASSEDMGDFTARLAVGFYVLWALSGYYGAWLLIKKGHGLGLGGCAILAGGLPILLPLVLGGFMYLWGKSAKDKHAAPEAYLVCPHCQKPTPLKASFCAHCGKPISQGNKKQR